MFTAKGLNPFAIVIYAVTSCIYALQMNFYLQVTFADGDIYSWHKVLVRLHAL